MQAIQDRLKVSDFMGSLTANSNYSRNCGQIVFRELKEIRLNVPGDSGAADN